MSSIFDDAFSQLPAVSFGDIGTGNQPQFVQGGIFGGLSSAPISFNPTFGSTPATTQTAELPGTATTPSVGGAGSAAFQGIPGAASAAGITGGSVPPASTTGSTAGAGGASTLNNWFVRAVIVILGFVFVAVGLSQFGVVQRGIGR